MRTFRLRRIEDVHGVSGVGVVAEGVEFNNGKVVLGWLGSRPSVEVHDSLRQVNEIHGHGGKTVVEFLDIRHSEYPPQQGG